MRPPAPVLALALCLAVAVPAHADSNSPPGKIETQTVGTTPQVLTAAERAKREQALRPITRAPRSARVPAPWIPPELRLSRDRAQALTPAAPAARTAAPPRDPRAEVRAYLSHVRHGAPPPAKAAPVHTIGSGPATPSAAELAKRRVAPAGGPR
jgi:hypothetical protein